MNIIDRIVENAFVKFNESKNSNSDGLAIEYVTQTIFKGKSLKWAVADFIKKFNNQSNMFLGTVNYTDAELTDLVVTDKAITAIQNAKKMKPGFGHYSREHAVQYFKIPEKLIRAKIAKLLPDGDDGNGILN